MSSYGNFSLDFFWPKPKEPITPCGDFLFRSYKKLKEKCITELSLANIPYENDKSMVTPHTPTIVDEPMIEPKALSNNQDKYTIVPPSISYKRPRDNKIILFVPPKIKQVYRPKEIVVF